MDVSPACRPTNRPNPVTLPPHFPPTSSPTMPAHHPLADFLAAARLIHASGGGTQETSYYTALDNLLDGVGATLKPKVRCLMQLKNLGAGMPDGGLFTQD